MSVVRPLYNLDRFLSQLPKERFAMKGTWHPKHPPKTQPSGKIPSVAMRYSSKQRPSYHQGDTVTCIDTLGSGSHKLTAGKKYKVIGLYIDDDKDWMADVT